MRIGFFILLFFSVVSAAVSQNTLPEDEEVDNQIWLNYAMTVPSKLNERFSYGGDIGVRGFVSRQDWNQFLIRPSASWSFDERYSVSLATAIFSTYNRYDANVTEYRIHQDFNVNWPDFGFMRFFYRLRMEQRWFLYDNLPDEYTWRARILGGIETEDFRLRRGGKPFYFQFLWEGFQTLEEEGASELFVNNTRLHVAYGHRISSSFRYEAHFINQKSRFFDEDGDKTTQFIFRIRLFYRIQRGQIHEEEEMISE